MGVNVYSNRVSSRSGGEPSKSNKGRTNKGFSRQCRFLGEPTGEVFPPSRGLGDHARRAIEALGITQEGFSRVAAQFMGQDKGCGCSRRQRALNWFGEKLGLPSGQGAALQKAIELESFLPENVKSCNIYGKCLTTTNCSREVKTIVEAEGYHLCNGCMSKELVELKV